MIRWVALLVGVLVMVAATLVYVRRPEPEYRWSEPEDGVQPPDPYPLGAAECAEAGYYSLLEWLSPDLARQRAERDHDAMRGVR